MELEGKKVLVLGAGKSGINSATLLARKGAVVALHDKKPVAEWSEAARSLKENFGVGLIEGMLPSWLLDQIELVVISPGVPSGIIPARYVERKDGEVIGEVELAYRFLKNPFIGITGSNGKTTTTTLVGRLLADAGIASHVGGNIGVPLVSMVEEIDADSWIVAELSSFQLETIRDFRPRIGICLNVTPNHMDRYELFSDYAAAKHRLFLNQTNEDLAVLNADDEITASWAKGLRSTVTMFSTRKELKEGLFLRGRDLVSRAGGTEKVLTTRDEMQLRGLHNVENVLAALAAGLACGADPVSMRGTIANFNAVEHRLEFCGRIRGISFYNDSKATSVDATKKALEALSDEPGKIVLIMGGLGKKAPYAPIAGLIREHARTLVLIGEDASNIEAQLGGVAETLKAESMYDAVRRSFESAIKGDTVLLAPACASFDMYKSFEERGAVFKEAVQDLAISLGAVDASAGI
ncbi:MAG: UDP-N-acetylmuramoyl-L-alanine--D-glutamate ligase [Acidobacteriota bacterium]|nr:UDP-N-acetylmuramoyl-L-alanine--D-glutamate ligase [Acidobacteriota bacterium]